MPVPWFDASAEELLLPRMPRDGIFSHLRTSPRIGMSERPTLLLSVFVAVVLEPRVPVNCSLTTIVRMSPLRIAVRLSIMLRDPLG